MDIKTRIFIVTLSSILLIVIINFIRKKNLKEEYALLWIVLGIIMVIVPLLSDYLDEVAYLIGIYYPPQFVFLLAFLLLLAIIFHYSIVISKISEQNRILAQNVAILEKKIVDLEKGQKE